MCHSFSVVADKRLCMYFVAGLLKVLIIGIYISIVKVPYAYSMPATTHPDSLNTATSCQFQIENKPWWINPNNYTSLANPADDGAVIDKNRLLTTLLAVVNNSLARARSSVSILIF